MYFRFNYVDFKKIYILPIGYNLPKLYELKDATLNCSMKNEKIDFFDIERQHAPTISTR